MPTLHDSRNINFDNAWLAATLRGMGEAVIISDGSSVPKITFLNKAAEEMTGWKNEDAIGKPLEHVFPTINEETRLALINPVTQVIATGRVQGLTNHTALISRNGGEFIIEESASPIFDSNGLITAVVLIFRDVTSRHRLEREKDLANHKVVRAREELQDFFMQSPLPMVIMEGPEFIFTLVNPPYIKFVGRNPLGMSVLEAFARDEVDLFLPMLHEVYYAGVSKVGKEMPFNFKDSEGNTEYHWLNIGYHPFRSYDGQIKGLFAIIEDVTEQVEARRKIEESAAELRHAKELFELCLSSASMGTWNFDFRTDEGFLSDPAMRILNVKESVFKASRSHLKMVHPLDRRRFLEFWQLATQGKSSDDFLFRISDMHGKSRWLRTKGMHLRDSDCNVLSMSGVISDFTERKKIEDQLRDEKDKLDIVFEQTPAALALWRGPNFLVEKVNSNFQDIFQSRQIVNRPFFEATDEFEDQIFPKLFRQVYETGEPFTGHEQLAVIRSASGETTAERYFDFTYIRLDDTDGRGHRIYNHSLDVTERVMARRSLEESEQKLTLALETGRIGFFDWDLSCDRISYSELMRSNWIIASDAAQSLEDHLLHYHEEDRASFRSDIETSLREKKPLHSQYRVVRSDGSMIWVETRGKPIISQTGKISRFFGTAIDITEAREAAEELKRAKEMAEFANETKTQFLANMSHEIRTPLSAIIGFADLLRGKDINFEDRSHYLETISRNGRALTRIIDDILDIAKVESGKLEIETIEFSFLKLVEEVFNLFMERAKSKGIYLRLDMAKNVPLRILSDPTRLRQILINIIGNAIKFTHEGGVTLHVSNKHAPDRFFHFVICVEDSGVGISEDHRKNLFQAFVQADNTTTRKYGGTGLGLVLSQRLARALGGDIEIAPNNEREGCRFIINFQAKAPKHRRRIQRFKYSKRKLAALESDLPLKNIHVLVAEDSFDNQFIIREILLSKGASVHTVNNGLEALRSALITPCDIVLMDIQMPEMDGYEATRSLRAAGFKKPVIALTAHAMAEDRARTRAAGCNGHLTKPIDSNALVHMLENFLPHH
jgi:PAS domain S-box-containing protein